MVTEAVPELVTSLDHGVLRCTLNRPRQLNALTPELLFALTDAVESAVGARAVVLEGAGERAFSSGFDIKVLASRGVSAHEGRPLDRALTALTSCKVPTVALIRGHCLGAGLDLALACDFRIAVPDSKFGIPAIRIGTVYEPRSIERIQKIVGVQVTKRLFMLGQQFNGESAHRAGIVDELIDEKTLSQSLQDWTGSSADAPAAVAAHKEIINALLMSEGRGKDFWAPLDELRSRSLHSQERQQAVSSFASATPRPPEAGRAGSNG